MACYADHEIDEDSEEWECDICGGDHETRDCGECICGACFEILDNCDCDECQEIDAAEWVKLGMPQPRKFK